MCLSSLLLLFVSILVSPSQSCSIITSFLALTLDLSYLFYFSYSLQSLAVFISIAISPSHLLLLFHVLSLICFNLTRFCIIDVYGQSLHFILSIYIIKKQILACYYTNFYFQFNHYISYSQLLRIILYQHNVQVQASILATTILQKNIDLHDVSIFIFSF